MTRTSELDPPQHEEDEDGDEDYGDACTNHHPHHLERETHGQRETWTEGERDVEREGQKERCRERGAERERGVQPLIKA